MYCSLAWTLAGAFFGATTCRRLQKERHWQRDRKAKRATGNNSAETKKARRSHHCLTVKKKQLATKAPAIQKKKESETDPAFQICDNNDKRGNMNTSTHRGDALDVVARAIVANAVRTATDAVRASQPGLFTAAIMGPDGQVVAHGRNRVFDACDPTAHAEIEAIRAACRTRGSIALDDCVLCSNAEPCPMCLSAAYWAGIRLVYYACPKETVAKAVGFDDARLYVDLALPADQRTLIKTVHVDCADAADAFYAWRDRETLASTMASTVSPSARVVSLSSTASASAVSPPLDVSTIE